MPTDLTKQYEKQLQASIKRAQKRILKIYEQSVVEIALRTSTINLVDKPFSLSLYPILNAQIEQKIDEMHLAIYNEIVQSVSESWQLSNTKNDLIVDKRLAGKVPTTKAKQILYDPNLGAYNSFISRKEKGMNLSERVWNLLEPFKSEMEQSLGLSIAKGKSASTMATEMKKYLHEPDKLFRRVRNKEGQLALSKKAREYRPGQGVYRSSYKNALRLTRTENNIAYRTADFERWNNLPFVIGIEIHTSNNHPQFDICDTLKGKYPKDFKFTGWHPQCICFQVPIMMSDDEYDRIEDQILAGEAINVTKKIMIAEPPKSFTKFLSDNSKRIKKWSNKPYWIKDNKKYI